MGDDMIQDLLTPEAHGDPYVWGAALLAHGFFVTVFPIENAVIV